MTTTTSTGGSGAPTPPAAPAPEATVSITAFGSAIALFACMQKYPRLFLDWEVAVQEKLLEGMLGKLGGFNELAASLLADCKAPSGLDNAINTLNKFNKDEYFVDAILRRYIVARNEVDYARETKGIRTVVFPGNGVSVLPFYAAKKYKEKYGDVESVTVEISESGAITDILKGVKDQQGLTNINVTNHTLTATTAAQSTSKATGEGTRSKSEAEKSKPKAVFALGLLMYLDEEQIYTFTQMYRGKGDSLHATYLTSGTNKTIKVNSPSGGEPYYFRNSAEIKNLLGVKNDLLGVENELSRDQILSPKEPKAPAPQTSPEGGMPRESYLNSDPRFAARALACLDKLKVPSVADDMKAAREKSDTKSVKGIAPPLPTTPDSKALGASVEDNEPESGGSPRKKKQRHGGM